MDLLMLILAVCVIGFVIWLLTTQIPMPPLWARAIQISRSGDRDLRPDAFDRVAQCPQVSRADSGAGAVD
jgi:hypothetical protein